MDKKDNNKAPDQHPTPGIKKEKVRPADEIYSDGSGGAFSATEDVTDEQDTKPLPPDHDTPY